jgi:hypothetical protein
MRSLRSLTLLVGIAALSACEDSSAPVTVDVAYVATRFDALGRARADLGDPGGAFAARGAALALRLGVRPSPVSIAVDGVTEEYLALETEHAFGFTGADAPLPPPPLVVRMMVAWRGLLPDRFVTITVPGDTGTFGLLHALTSTEANSIFASDANSIFAPSSREVVQQLDVARSRRACGRPCRLRHVRPVSWVARILSRRARNVKGRR